MYQNLSANGTYISAPYVINVVPLAIRKAMLDANIPADKVNAVFGSIWNQQTELGSRFGKGTPEELQIDLDKLLETWTVRDVRLTEPTFIQELMRTYLIGIDCSGLVYNMLKYVFKDYQFDNMQKLFAWSDNTMRASRAGAFVFNSDQLLDIAFRDIQPLDIWLYDDLSHVGVIVNVAGDLYLAESSIVYDVSKAKIVFGNNEIIDRPFWTKKLRKGEITIKRIPMLNCEE